MAAAAAAGAGRWAVQAAGQHPSQLPRASCNARRVHLTMPCCRACPRRPAPSRRTYSGAGSAGWTLDLPFTLDRDSKGSRAHTADMSSGGCFLEAAQRGKRGAGSVPHMSAARAAPFRSLVLSTSSLSAVSISQAVTRVGAAENPTLPRLAPPLACHIDAGCILMCCAPRPVCF